MVATITPSDVETRRRAARAGTLVVPLACALAGLLGCRENATSTPPAPDTTAAAAGASASGAAAASAAAAASDEAALSRAEAAAKRLGGTLRQKLVDAMSTGGAGGAVRVCSEEAQALVSEIRTQTGAVVGRSSLRLRNPADAGPGWVEEWLKVQGERPAAGVTGVRQVVQTPTGSVARVLVPIAIEPTCLSCHGEPERIAPEVKSALAARYPGDKATGYRIGDLRGALWAELPVAKAP